MKKILSILLLVLLVFSQTYTTTDCVCDQLLSPEDCKKSVEQNCAWDATKYKCIKLTTPITPTTPTITYAQYCERFTSTDCPNTTGCAWVNAKCTFFTGCTPFAKTTDFYCQNISSKCITNGTHCIEKGACSTYLIQESCVKNAAGAYCIWDTTKNVCVDITACDKLPSSLSSDYECRSSYIPNCTAKTGGGCQDSGENCSDQKSQESCVWNKYQSQACHWNPSLTCVDLVCEMASSLYVTDADCIQFLFNGSCTTKSGGGCVKRTTCQNAQIEAACVKDQNGQKCYWSDSTCVVKTCNAAPSNLTTNDLCQKFMNNCITTGSGCQNIGNCNEATIEAACDKNKFGNDCIWDTTCLDKICVNAPKINNTHDLCTNFLSTCTVNSSGAGCTPRTCDNAPLSIVSNDNCEAYMPGAHCVTKSEGGCVRNSACITLDQVACVKDINNNDCYWDNYCKNKTCANAPSSANTHALCQAFLNKCTVNSQGQCVDFICSNISSPGICSTDFYGNPCVYKAQCSQKDCESAIFSTTHLSCQSFNSKCILSSFGVGCVQMPQNCSDVYSKVGCYLRQTQNATAPCIWTGTNCVDKICSTLNKNIQTTFDCNKELQGCVSANPINGIVAGCMALPATCIERLSQDNCGIQGSVTCIWNAVNNLCVLKTCLTASIFGTTGQLSNYNSLNCSGYLTGCILNNTNDGCIAQVSNCSDLNSSVSCGSKVKIGDGDCYWNQVSKSCVDTACTNISLTSHQDCNGVLNSCTVSAAKLNCQALVACDKYTISDQCQVSALGKKCIWTGTACRDQICTDADKTYQTPDSCIKFAVTSGVCNLVPRVQGKGCMIRQTLCSNYLEKTQCFKDISNSDCVWNNNKCLQKSKVLCSDIILDKYIDSQVDNCELIYYKCKTNATSNACIDKVCGDYKNINGLSTGTKVQTDNDCSTLDDTCTIGSAQTCQIKQDQCSSYSADSCTNSISTKQGLCIWHGSCYPVSTACSSFQGTTCTSVKNACTPATGATNTTPCTIDCTLQLKGTYADCQAEDTSCSINSTGTNCINRLATCNLYGKTLTSCVYSAAGPCVNDGTNCLVPTNTNCNLIKGTNLTDSLCAKYNSGCIASRDGTACASQQAQCSTYDIANCTRTATTECIGQTDDTTKICISVTTKIECKNIFLGIGNYSDTLCKKKNSLCAFNGTSGCITRTCDNAKNPKSFSDCNNWLNTCTYTGTGCVTISAKCVSQQSTACYQATEGECVAIGTLCLKKTCDNAPITNSSHTDCTTFLSSCTVARTGGCIDRQACNIYTSQLQCTYDANGKSCYWSDSNYLCLDLTCENIDQTSNFNSHQLCNQKLSMCTVKAVNGAAVNGCQPLGTCSNNQIQIQCVINSTGGNCEWNTNLMTPACVDKTCTSAPNSYNNHSLCKDHIGTNSCTVWAIAGANGAANTLSGCIPLRSCSSYIDVEQCHVNADGVLCVWNGTTCVDFSCATSPITNNTHELCQSYKTGCTVNQNGNGCMALLATCTSYQIEINCVIDASGNNCYWNSKTTSCAAISCDSVQNNSNIAIQRSCQQKECSDFLGSTHSTCQTINGTCTAGSGGYCAKIKKCADTTVRPACVQGTDGPCLWILNTDGSTGACYPYLSCKSLAWTTDQKCKMISPNCTTNGSTCVGITLCTETNVKGGCVTGYDGNCVQTVSFLGSTDGLICKAFTSCSDAYYATHLQCQKASFKCTTDGTTGCIELAACSTYAQASCYVNYQGLEKNFQGNVKSTGICIWDNTDTACRDQTCTDLTGKNHELCSAQLSNCTSDGSICIQQSNCSSYTEAQCGFALGFEGVCFWQVVTATVAEAVCRVKKCEDINNGTITIACLSGSSSCISNGTYCISKANCSTYTTKTACNSGGLDGICVFTASTNDSTEIGTCVVMNSCASASNDQKACTTYKQKCAWTVTQNMSSECVIHTCASYYTTNNICANFLSWSGTKQQICQLKNGICIETDPVTFNQADCYTASGYTYTWNASSSKCGLCSAPAIFNNSTNTNQSNDTNSTTEYTFMLGFAIAIFGFFSL